MELALTFSSKCTFLTWSFLNAVSWLREINPTAEFELFGEKDIDIDDLKVRSGVIRVGHGQPWKNPDLDVVNLSGDRGGCYERSDPLIAGGSLADVGITLCRASASTETANVNVDFGSGMMVPHTWIEYETGNGQVKIVDLTLAQFSLACPGIRDKMVAPLGWTGAPIYVTTAKVSAEGHVTHPLGALLNLVPNQASDDAMSWMEVRDTCYKHGRVAMTPLMTAIAVKFNTGMGLKYTVR
jgi:hypothetical protein